MQNGQVTKSLSAFPIFNQTRTHALVLKHTLSTLCAVCTTVKPVASSHPKRTPKIGFQYRLSLNAGQKYCRMLHGEHSAILLTSNKLPFSIKTLVLSIFKGSLKTGFTFTHALICFSNFGKGHIYSNQWKLNFEHNYLSSQRSEYCLFFGVAIVETQRTFLWQKNFFFFCVCKKPNNNFSVKIKNQHMQIKT